MRNLYTIILDFRGGTYIAQIPRFIAQIPRSSPMKAVIDWSDELLEEDVQAWKLDVEQLRRLVREDELVAIEGLTNAWCLSVTIDGQRLSM